MKNGGFKSDLSILGEDCQHSGIVHSKKQIFLPLSNITEGIAAVLALASQAMREVFLRRKESTAVSISFFLPMAQR